MGIFNSVVGRKPKRNKFNLSHERKMSIKMGLLYPILVNEVVPSDSFKVNSEIFIRLAPLISPVMHRIHVYTHYFFVPNRLVWNEWEDFITGGEDGLQEPVFPTVAIAESTSSSFEKGTLADYFGIPVHGSPQPGALTRISALPFRAYQLIYNEFFRDQNLESPVEFSKSSGPVAGGNSDFDNLMSLRKRAWEKDYFTSALPWPQRGGAVEVPTSINYSVQATMHRNPGGGAVVDGGATIDTAGDHSRLMDGGTSPLGIHNIDSLGTSINDLRRASRLQEWLEKSARGGSRYIEQILSHFGVRSSDARLQRPEFLGSGKQNVVISEVLQQSESNVSTENATPLGEMAGHGISVGRSNGFKRSFEEHGYIVGVISILPKTAYQDGIERHWTKFDKFDHYWPEFAHLGEQEIKTKEIYADYSDPELEELVWGYQQRYAEYKYQQSSVHGDFRDNLDFWHMGRIFSSTPSLSKQFVQSDPRTDIFAVDNEDPTLNEDQFYCQIYNKVSALRPMPYHAIPTL